VLFTRTIRRKLLVSLGLVLMMMLGLSVSGISGLQEYRKMVRSLDYEINEAPHREELVAAIALLHEPLLLNVDGAPRLRQERVDYQRRHLREHVAEAQQAILEFRRKYEDMPPTQLPSSQRPITSSLLAQIDQLLAEVAALEPQLADERQHNTVLHKMQAIALRCQLNAQNVPDPVEGMTRSLHHARTVYRSTLTAVWISSAVACVMFIVVVHNGYAWIFKPIRKLHQGALRVARGDFNYRVRLSTHDEMSELADAFNRMTSRFQEITVSLDRQVQERSQQLVRSERLAGVGFLAAGVAHEINNPLSAISMAAESLEGRLSSLTATADEGEAQVVRQYLQMIQAESVRCKQITERLLDFSRGRDATREMADVTHIVSEVVAMVQYLSKYREKTIVFTHETPCYAEVNSPEIKQVVLNLVANGLEAMERTGTLHIELFDHTDEIVLKFRDDGCGMTQEVRDNMFEPFFTQKPGGQQGTGLGLSISHRIIVQHGGTLSASSDGPGLGCTFSVSLPRQAALQAAA